MHGYAGPPDAAAAADGRVGHGTLEQPDRPVRRRAAVAETACQHRREPPRLVARRRVPNGVDMAMDLDETAGGEAMRDRAPTETQRIELRAPDEPVLASRERADRGM